MPLYLEDLLKPFEYLDISHLYSRYSQVIDFTIAFLVFLGVTKVTLSKRYEGRGGDAICIGISIALSIGFIVMERSLGFSLRSFGGVGASIFIVIVGLVLFGLFRSVGLHSTNSFCLSYVIIYLSIRAVVPNIFDFIARTIPFINGILGLIFLFSLGKLLYSLYRGMRDPKGFSPDALLKSEKGHYIEEGINHNVVEQKVLNGKVEKITKKDLKNSDTIINHLEKIKVILKEYGGSEKGRRELSKELTRLSKEEKNYLSDLNTIQKLVVKLAAYDEKELNNLKDRINKVSDNEKPFIKREILIAEKKLEAEKTLNQFKKDIILLTDKFNNFLKTAINILNAGSYPQDAIRYLDDCIKIEAYIKKAFKDISLIEAELASLSENAGKTYKKEQDKFG